MGDQWLVCNLYKGMFSDELTVEYREHSYFVPKQSVEPLHAGRAKVRVCVFWDRKTPWAILPTEDSATIPVEQRDLSAA